MNKLATSKSQDSDKHGNEVSAQAVAPLTGSMLLTQSRDSPSHGRTSTVFDTGTSLLPSLPIRICAALAPRTVRLATVSVLRSLIDHLKTEPLVTISTRLMNDGKSFDVTCEPVLTP